MKYKVMNRSRLFICCLLTSFLLLVLLAACVQTPVATPPTETSETVTTMPADAEMQAVGLSGDIQMFTTPRDPYLEPFSPLSVWNIPLGKRANIVGVGYLDDPEIGSVTVDTELNFRSFGGEPVRQVYDPNSFTKRCEGTGTRNNGVFSIPIADDVLVADATLDPFSTPNAVTTFLLPDKKTIVQFEPFARCEKGGPVYGYKAVIPPDVGNDGDPSNDYGEKPLDVRNNDDLSYQNLYGLGTYGTHYGSLLSGFGGSIRYGELTGNAPIRHALKINVWGAKFLYRNFSEPFPYNLRGRATGYRWPAISLDSGGLRQNEVGVGYCTKEPCLSQKLKDYAMGSLLAIPGTVTPESLGLKTEPAKKIFYALQNYGAYIVDDSFYSTTAFAFGEDAENEFAETFGYSFGQSYATTGPAGAWASDLKTIIKALGVVSNNTPLTPGGPGERRAPLKSFVFKNVDSSAPSIPLGLGVSRTGVADAELSWTASSDNTRVMRYEVLLGEDVVARTWSKTKVTVSGLQPSTTYSFKIRAVDVALNRSSLSSATSATTQAGYAANFNNNALPEGWTVSSTTKVRASGRALQLQSCPPPDYACGDGQTSAFYNKFTQGNYTLNLNLQSGFTGADSNISRVFFNRRNDNNAYYLQTLQGSNAIKLFKIVNGVRTELGNTPLNAAINNTLSLSIRYDAATGSITIEGTQNGVTKQLFNVTDSSHTAGQFGIATDFSNSTVDDVVFSGTLGDPPPPVTGAFSTNFDDGTAPGWDLANSTLTSGQLRVGNFGNNGSAFHTGLSGGSYTFTFQAALYGGNYATARVYFNYLDANNNYRLELVNRTDTGTACEVRLIKRVGGTDTYLTSNATYAFPNKTLKYDLNYNAAAKTITATVTEGSTVTTLFNAVYDDSFSSGSVGFSEGYNSPFIDYVTLVSNN